MLIDSVRAFIIFVDHYFSVITVKSVSIEILLNDTSHDLIPQNQKSKTGCTLFNNW